ncbi:MAG: hypothetical protein ACFFCP_18920, partial [Promethearchaeota archaeon]
MTNRRIQLLSAISIVIILLSGITTILPSIVSYAQASPMSFVLGDVPSDQIPLRRVALVAPDALSYNDEFAYMATIPTSVFYYNDTQYISPLIYAGDSQSQEWLLEDWREYLESDGGIQQGFAVGNFADNYLNDLQKDLGAKIYPRIKGSSAADIAAKIAVSEWSSANTAIIALVTDSFTTPLSITGSASHTFQNQASELSEFGG